MSKNPTNRKNDAASTRITLTAAQQGIWYAQQLDPSNASYQIGQFLDLRGELDPTLMRIALTKVVADIDSLSMRFDADDDGPFATLARPEPTDDLLEIVDLRYEANQDAAFTLARERMHAEMTAPRDLTGDALFGAILFRLANGRSLFFQRVHHIMLDGYSAVIALHYLARAYTELEKRSPRGVLTRIFAGRIAKTAAKTSSPFPSHDDLLEALQEYRDSNDFEADQEFWKAQFEEESVVEGLEGTSNAVARSVVRVDRVLSRDEAAPLQGLGRELPKTMVGIIAVYLSKITGQERVSLGLPVTARRGKVAKATPSMLSSILPLRVDVAPTATFASTIVHAGDVLREVVKHQRFRTEDLANAPAQAGPSVNLLPVIDALKFGAARGEVRILSTGPVHDLSIVISGLESDAAAPTIQLEGDAELHTQETLTEHADRLVALILDAMQEPEVRAVSDARIVTEEEAEALLAQGEGPDAPLEPQTVLEAFAAAVAVRGEDTAVVAPDGTRTFAELDTESTKLANFLVKQGARAGSCVAVRIERSVHLPVLVLAVLKSGGVYVPLDPEYPIDRVENMIEDSSPIMLLTSAAQAKRDMDAGASWTIPMVAIDTDTGAAWRRASSDASSLPASEGSDLAYVVFTSGSTGRPKGVGVERFALRNLFQHHRAELFDPAAERLGRPLRVAHTAGLSFDAAWDPLLWLFAGHELHVVDDDVRRDPERLSDYFASNSIDSIETTPSFAEALLAAGAFERTPHPSVVALGGEEVGASLWEALGAVPDLFAVNFYGPTETTVDSLTAAITSGEAPHIGTSVRNSRHYILDASLQPVPERAVGELYLAGSNVARGYVGQPGLSAERFIADPFASDGSRMYRTGDVVRRRKDGSLRFLGRLDDQVKVRGYRVELSEIEAALRRNEQVVAAAAIVAGEAPATRVVAYITTQGEATRGEASQGSRSADLPAKLRDALRDELPDYMVPSSIMVLDALPLTANGKLDRRALPTPESGANDAAQQPRNDTERAVAAAFAEVLGVASIGIDDDFFAAGGHSLLATRLASALTTALERTVTVRDVFERPTVAGLAAQLGDEETATAPHAVLAPQERPERIPVSLAQRRLWFLNRLEPASAAYNIPIVLELDGTVDVPALRAAFTDVVARHETLRTIFPFTQDEPEQRVLGVDEVHVPFLAVQVPADDLQSIVREESLRPFDITREIPLRAVLLQTAPETSVLVATMHHIASDGWSLAPFAKDLSLAYAARTNGTSPEFAPLPVDYVDFTLWQRARLGEANDSESVLAEQIEFWRRELAGAPEELDLPRDRARGTANAAQSDSHGVGELELLLDPERHAAIRALAAQHRTSVFIVLHAALAIALQQQGAGDDIVLGTPVAGRTDPQLDALVGFFVNTVVLRTSLAQNPTLAEVLERVRTNNTDAYAHQDTPFDALVDALRPARVADRHPLFQVLLTLQSNEPAELQLEGLQIRVPGAVTSAGVKTDLLVDFATPEGEGGPLRGALGFDRSLFDEATIARLRDGLDRVLQAFVAAPEQRLSDLPLHDEQSAAELAALSAGASREVTTTVLERFAATVREHGDATAVRDDSAALTFTALHERVEHAAGALLAQGITAGDRVAIALPRSNDAIVLLLAALRAGAVAVPIDVAYPEARIAQMLRDSAARLLVVKSAEDVSIDPAEAEISATVVTVETLLQATAGELPSLPKAADVAYLVYTSGTTGTPKGVQVSHAALANVLAHHETELIAPVQESVSPALPNMLHLSGLGFDAAWDPMLWLVTGTTLVMAGEELQKNAEAVVAAIAEYDIDVIETTPSYVQQLIAFGLVRDRARALTVLVGGEAVSQQLWDELADAAHVHAWNLYGPSEFTVDSVLTPITPGAVNIGHAIPNVTARVLDSALRQVPLGVTGELYLSGASAADGYFGRPAETADRFVADPFAEGTRMYRTGDLVRRRASGELEFLSRNDEQVKIRGYRIEPSDVARAIERVDGVERAVVRVVTPGGPETARLLAWFVGSTETDAIRQQLARELPKFMVPSTLTEINEIPLTPNGKIDVDALPEATLGHGTDTAGTPDEQRMAAIFAEVLHSKEVGRDGDFFALGGHSLLAVTLMGRIRDEFSATLPLRAIFDAPTPAGLVAALGSSGSTQLR
ncbi:amino acid adenylation domain-containing protein [Humidisolicoccus flavus]|uniref:amino acid adenylation domain-containing protein n=1 Tax=Humidisolicoccus flavus TaxID=3111414 RepID=UPI00324806E2